MRKTAIVILICIFAALVTAMQHSDESTYDREAIEKAVLKVNADIVQAGNSLDADKFFAYILDSDKGLIIQDGTLFKTRQEAYDAIKQGFQGISSLARSFDQTYVTVVSPQCAVLTGTGKSTTTLNDGRTFSGPFAVSMIFVLKDGQWRLLQGHYSSPNAL